MKKKRFKIIAAHDMGSPFVTNVVLDNVSNSFKHPKCMMELCNHPLDPPEYGCGYNTKIDCDNCKYNNRGGRKDPEAKCNQ